MSALFLKIIALTTMIIDHTGAVFPSTFPYIFRCIGRMAFPIYVFLIAEGCRHSKNIWKYMFRLGTFAIISEIPFDLCFNRTRNGFNFNFLESTNVFYTLFLGVLAVAEYKIIKEWIDAKEVKLKNDYIAKVYNIFKYLPACVPALGCVFLAGWLDTDYGEFGVLWIFIMFLCDKKWMQIICAFVGVSYKYGTNVLNIAFDSIKNFDFGFFSRTYPLVSYDYQRYGFALAAVVLLIIYNGKRGKNIKQLFYLAYPVHLSVLGLIWLIQSKL